MDSGCAPACNKFNNHLFESVGIMKEAHREAHGCYVADRARSPVSQHCLGGLAELRAKTKVQLLRIAIVNCDKIFEILVKLITLDYSIVLHKESVVPLRP